MMSLIYRRGRVIAVFQSSPLVMTPDDALVDGVFDDGAIAPLKALPVVIAVPIRISATLGLVMRYSQPAAFRLCCNCSELAGSTLWWVLKPPTAAGLLCCDKRTLEELNGVFQVGILAQL